MCNTFHAQESFIFRRSSVEMKLILNYMSSENENSARVPLWHQPPLLTHHQYRYRDTLHHSQRHEWHIRILGVLACMVSLSSGGLVAIGVLWYVHLRCRQLSPDDWATEKHKQREKHEIILLKQIKSIITHTHTRSICVCERQQNNYA